MGKKGQVSVFIIVGIIIFALLMLTYSLVNDMIIKPNTLPKEADSIVLFTELCMDNIAQQAIDVMRVQGGYIRLPKELDVDPRASVNIGFKVPYWYYSGRNYMPSKKAMEEELSGYIKENLPLCLANYSDFKSYTIKPLSDMAVSAKIGDEDVKVHMDYKLAVSPSQAEEFQIDSFDKSLDSKYGKMYNLARELMTYENNIYFLENYTDEMIACSDYLPYEGMELSCKPKLWFEPEMEAYTKTMIMHNLHMLMFENTAYEETGIPYYDKQYKVKFTENDYEDMSVEVMYNPSMGMDFHVQPSDNGVVKPFEFKITEYLRSCIKVYHHKYTLDFPVVVQLNDLENEGDIFMFATPVIIKRGMPNRYHEVSSWPSDYDITMARDYCANTSKFTVFGYDENGVIKATPSIRENRQYSLRVFAEDSFTGDRIPGVKISYQCVMFQCPIGYTSHPLMNGLYTGASPMLSEKFPDCSGGIVLAEKAGYNTGREQVSVEKETDTSQVIVSMNPLKRFNYKFKVIEEHNGLISERDLKPEEYVLMTLKNTEEYYEQSIVYPAEDSYFSNLSLMVGDFTYDLDIKLVSDEQYFGGIETNWSLTSEDVQNNNNIVFYTLRKDIPTPSTAEEWQEVLDFQKEYTDDYPPQLT